MESRYNRELVSFDKLREKMREKGLKGKEVAEAMGVSSEGLSEVLCGRASFRTDTIAKVCMVLQCSVRDIIEFKGIEIKEFYKEPNLFEVPKEAKGEVSYAPLRNLITGFYKWKEEKKTIQDFFDKLPRTGVGYKRDEEKIKIAVGKMLEAKGGVGSSSGGKVAYSEGLRGAERHKLLHDKPVRLQRLYDICYVLGCTPDYVMTYK